MSNFEDFSQYGLGCAARGALRILLVSGDTHLVELFREAVRELGVEYCDIVLLEAHQAHSLPAELLIWDTDFAGFSREPHANTSQQEVFLVNRKRIDEFLTEMPLGAGSTLLKPVTKRILQIFLEQALRRAHQKDLSEVENPATGCWKNALQCLLMANLKLQEYDQDRTNFIARAVHDFRAPLMAASGYCSILLQQTMGQLNPGQLDLIQRMQRSLRKLTRMSSGMLQLSLVKQVTKGLSLQESSLEGCIKNAIQEIETLAHEKNISICVELNDHEQALYVDPEQIEQVMINLLENACRFTPKGGSIEVHGYAIQGLNGNVNGGDLRICRDLRPSSSGSSNFYRVDVSDTGPGILAENLEKIFEEYTSYGGPRDRSGGGLGLAICKMILTAHGGRIWAENYLHGAKLSFVLPAGDLHRARTAPVDNDVRAVSKRAVS